MVTIPNSSFASRYTKFSNSDIVINRVTMKTSKKVNDTLPDEIVLTTVTNY